jgi:methyltransferase-like protein
MNLEENIKKWVKLDDLITQNNNKIKEFKQEKNKYEDSILNHIYTNNLNNAVAKINGGYLKFIENKQTLPITLTFLKKTLNNYINNEDEVEKLMLYIKQQREIKYVKDIKRYYE